MKIVISGASGMLGTALSSRLAADGHDVITLVRSRGLSGPGSLYWDPVKGEIEYDRLNGADAVIHLAGANIGGGRWTAERKKLILDSRVDGTALLARSLSSLKQPPGVFLCASATGYYGHTGDTCVNEDHPAGEGFLAEVCRAWEAAARPAKDSGIRTVFMRIGIVLDRSGGILEKTLLPFRLGLAGMLGDGSQYMSWITLKDLVEAFVFVLKTGTVSGAVNVVSPTPVINRVYTKTLGGVLS
ncbi:MAG: TIGR01777 family oxidoreductase, partial [candidate division Zixibacteria bacterium]|nr:TIGR01777 family oxidoreductase [candidate division Zixibacteria bacterium]